MSPILRAQLKNRIENSGNSLRHIATISGVNAGQLSRALRSEERSLISVDTLERLAAATGAQLVLVDQSPAMELIAVLAEVPEKLQNLTRIVNKLSRLNDDDLEIVHSLAERLSEKR